MTTPATTSTWTTLSVLDWTTQRFTAAGVLSPRLDAQVLLAHVLGCSRLQLYTGFDKPLSEDELVRYRQLIRRRLAGEPVAYLVGEQEFWSQPLWVDANVLVPRRDTETLIEAVLAWVPRDQDLTIVDVCTGSGAIAIALAKELPRARIIASDLSPAAVAVAARNIERAQVAERVQLLVGDLLSALPLPARGQVDLIVGNPPYITTAELAGLSAEVRHEPIMALDGGVDGLSLIRRIIDDAPAWLTSGGRCALEHGFEQGSAVRDLFAVAGWESIHTTADLAGHPRVTSALTRIG